VEEDTQKFAVHYSLQDDESERGKLKTRGSRNGKNGFKYQKEQ
jgi:hypothetical protein